MSVSDQHGGGLTLQRVLGPDLDNFRLFAHVSRFANDLPVIKSLEARCLNLSAWLESNTARSLFGCRPSSWLSYRRIFQKLHARRAASVILDHCSWSKDPLRALVCPQGAPSLYVMEEVTRHRPVEYVTWFMDDHLVRWGDGSWHYPSDIEQVLLRHLLRAKTVFVISPTMKDFFQARFGISCKVLFGPADCDADPAWGVPQGDSEIRLGYFGSLGCWQFDALRSLAEQLRRANAHLDVYSSEEDIARQLPNVTFRGRIAPNQVRSAMRSYDAVVLPASFDASMRHFTEFNIATKMSECLASGTVTVLIAPSYAAMVRFVERSGAAVVISDTEEESVIKALTRLRNPSERRAVLQAARTLVRSTLCTESMRLVWREGAASIGAQLSESTC